MSRMQEYSKRWAPRIDAIGSCGKIRPHSSAGKRLLAAGLLLSCANMANAALIEIPRVQGDRGYANDGRRQLLSWQENARYHARLNAYGVLQATANGLGRSAHPGIMDMARARDFSAHVVPTGNGNSAPVSDLFAAIDAPYGAIEVAKPSASDSDPELWTILLVAAVLIGYQIRRKSRIGAIRVRPLQY